MNTIRTEEEVKYTATALLRFDNDLQVIEYAVNLIKEHVKVRGFSATSNEIVQAWLKQEFMHEEREVFAALFLDSKYRLIAFDRMFYGTIDSVQIPSREVVKAALKHNAAAVIFVHNHPSGVPDPSRADKAITKKLIDALDLVDIKTLDHFIIGDTVYSFAAKGLL